MSTPKQSRRKTGTAKLEPIDWHEFANDAVLNGNMSTLYQRPLSEDPTTYASPEALLEIEKRAVRPLPKSSLREIHAPRSVEAVTPTVGTGLTVGLEPSAGAPGPKVEPLPPLD